MFQDVSVAIHMADMNNGLRSILRKLSRRVQNSFLDTEARMTIRSSPLKRMRSSHLSGLSKAVLATEWMLSSLKPTPQIYQLNNAG